MRKDRVMSDSTEPNGKVREPIEEETAEALAREGLKPGVVEPWEDGSRTTSQPDAFEWWYFDAQFDDGSTAVIVYNTKPQTRPREPLTPSATVIFRPPEGKSESVTSTCGPEEFTASTDGCDVRMGKSWIKGDLRHYQLHFDGEGLQVDLEMERKAPSWRPGSGVTYFDKKKTRYFAWLAAVPYGTVEGTITRGGEKRKVTGSVYHDHNWGNMVVGKLIDHWYWGRAHVGEFSLIFVEMVSIKILGMGGLKGHVFYLARGDRILTGDGLPLALVTGDFKEGPGGQSYPSKLDFHWHTDDGDVQMAIRNPKLIEVIDITKDAPSWKRPIIHLFANPLYYDFSADIELTVDLKGVKAKEHGTAIFEKMMFR